MKENVLRTRRKAFREIRISRRCTIGLSFICSKLERICEFFLGVCDIPMHPQNYVQQCVALGIGQLF